MRLSIAILVVLVLGLPRRGPVFGLRQSWSVDRRLAGQVVDYEKSRADRRIFSPILGSAA